MHRSLQRNRGKIGLERRMPSAGAGGNLAAGLRKVNHGRVIDAV
jgi:hypothetical protein